MIENRRMSPFCDTAHVRGKSLGTGRARARINEDAHQTGEGREVPPRRETHKRRSAVVAGRAP
jgi:hypothetical protein